VVGLVWSNDPEAYAGGSAATGMACPPPMQEISKLITQTKRDTLVLQVLGWGVKLTTSPP